MNDIEILIEKETRSVTKSTSFLGIENENLQQRLIFKIDEFVDGYAWLEIERKKSEKFIIKLDKVNETYQVKVLSSLLTEAGTIRMQLRINESETPDGIPVFKSKVFSMSVKNSIGATDEIPEEYPKWIEIADAKLEEIENTANSKMKEVEDLTNSKVAEIDNLNIAAERVSDGVEIRSTDKEGNTTVKKVNDGQTGPQGIKGDPGKDGVGIPAGGSANQLLKKKTDTDYDFEWYGKDDLVQDVISDESFRKEVGDLSSGIPEGGKKDQVLGKASNNDRDVVWMTVDMKDKENLFRYTEMPEANENNAGQMVQYIGETNDQFIQGKFYKNKAITRTELDKINVNGNAYLDTPIIMRNDYRIEIKVDWTDTTNYCFLISASTGYYALYKNGSTYNYSYNGSSGYSGSISHSSINEAVYVYNDENHKITLNGEVMGNLSSSLSDSKLPLRIFSSGYNFIGSLYYCKIWNGNGELVYDAAPVKIDNRFALYDAVNNYITYFNNDQYITEGTSGNTITEYKWVIVNKDPNMLFLNYKYPKSAYSYFTDQKWYDLFQYIIDCKNNGITLPNIINDGEILTSISSNSSSQSTDDACRWDFVFTKVKGSECTSHYGYFYTNYAKDTVYGPNSDRKAYYNYVTNGSFLTSHQSLDNYLSKTNTTSYTPTTDYHPSTKKYVDDTAKSVSDAINPQKWTDYGFAYDNNVDKVTKIDYTVENIDGTQYNFTLNDNGFYESTNQKIFSSYSICKIVFNFEIETEVTIKYISSGESSYDYGLFSQLDKMLSLSSTSDGNTGSTNVRKNCKGESSLEEKTLTYAVPSGEHFIYVKYIKDGSGDQGNDSLQFKVIDEIRVPRYTTECLATKKYVDSSSSRIYQDLYNSINKLEFKTVTVLPTENISLTTIYLLGESNPYTMNAYVDNNWVVLGTTEINFDPTVFTNTEETYTIAELRSNQVYKLGEITELTVNSYVTFDRETMIYFQSGENPTKVNIVEGLTHIGDCPKFEQEEEGSLLKGTCEQNSKYIISILNNIVLWKIIG